MSEYYGYAYAYFRWKGVARDMQQVYLALSRDGLHFEALNRNEPILIPDKGTKAARDSHIFRSRADGKYTIIATDLDVNRNQWHKYITQGSKSIHLWQSDDLVHWSEDQLVPVIDDRLGCIWAPKVCWDEETGEYVMAFSASAAGETAMSVYYTRTRDFRQFSDVRILIQRELNVEKKTWTWFMPPRKYLSYIDSTTVRAGDHYYRFTKNDSLQTIKCEVSTHIVEGFTLVREVVADEHGVEGPCLYKLNDSDNFILLMDGYSAPNSGVGYFPLIATGAELRSADFRRLAPQLFSLPEGCKHGSVMSLTREEYERLLSTFGGEKA